MQEASREQRLAVARYDSRPTTLGGGGAQLHFERPRTFTLQFKNRHVPKTTRMHCEKQMRIFPQYCGTSLKKKKKKNAASLLGSSYIYSKYTHTHTKTAIVMVF